MYKRNITKLLICGGGFKFFYLIGAIKYLSENNILENIQEFIGVSAGAILSTIFCIGYTLDELNSFVMEFNFEKLIDPHLDNLFENKGLDNGEIKKIMIQQFIKGKDIDPEITFEKLYEITKKKLSFVCTNITIPRFNF
jgi:predicted acylesterase/phospholipase RssA